MSAPRAPREASAPLYSARPIGGVFPNEAVDDARQLADIASMTATRAARHGLRAGREHALEMVRTLGELAAGPLEELENAARTHPHPEVRAEASRVLEEIRGEG